MEVRQKNKDSRKSPSHQKRKPIKKGSLDTFAHSLTEVDWFVSESVVTTRVGFSFFQAAIVSILEDVKKHLKVSAKQFEVEIKKFDSEYHAVIDCFIEQQKKSLDSETLKKMCESIDVKIKSFGRLNLHLEFCLKKNLVHSSTVLIIKVRGQSLDEKLT